MKKEEREKLEREFYNSKGYHDGTPQYIRDMSDEELREYIAEEKAKLRESTYAEEVI